MSNTYERKELIEMIYGYARVSTKKQNLCEQIAQLQKYSNEEHIEIYSEVASGKEEINKREEFKNLKKKLKKGDILVVTEFDRLGRYDDICKDIKKLLKKVKIETISDGVVDKENLEIYAERAINELNVLRNRAKRRKKSQKKKAGRPKLDDKVLNEFLCKYQKYKRGDYGNINIKQFAKKINKSRSLCYYYIKIAKERKNIQI